MMNVTATILTAPDTAGATGAAINSNQLISASFQAICADITAAGSVKIQASNDSPPQGQLSTFVPTNWTDIPNATASVSAGVAPLILIPVCSFRYMRAVYAFTSGGSTTINVQMSAMSV